MENNRYIRRYNKFIEFFKNNLPEGYVEKHHIIPKCMGGNNEKENLVLLPVRVHFLCHYLLYKGYPENRLLAHAFAMMGNNTPYTKRTFSSRMYEETKIARSLAMKGVPRPEYVKEKLRKPKENTENYKKPKTELHKKNISEGLKGKKHPWQHKVTSSEGYQNYHQERKKKAKIKKDFHRKNFLEFNISRKQYYKLFPDINDVTLKKYLKGL